MLLVLLAFSFPPRLLFRIIFNNGLHSFHIIFFPSFSLISFWFLFRLRIPSRPPHSTFHSPSPVSYYYFLCGHWYVTPFSFSCLLAHGLHWHFHRAVVSSLSLNTTFYVNFFLYLPRLTFIPNYLLLISSYSCHRFITFLRFSYPLVPSFFNFSSFPFYNHLFCFDYLV